MTCPGRSTAQLARADAEGLAELQAAFMASPWAARTPVDVEVPFDMVIGGTVVRGRIDAVFADADGGVTVVDWKTGDPPDTPEAKRHAAVQLAVYRLAWAALRGVPADIGPRGVPLRAVRADRRSRVAAGRRRAGRAAASYPPLRTSR